MLRSKKIALYILSGTLVLSSCTKDFQKINVTPSFPTETTVQPLINGVIKTLFLKGQEQTSIHNDNYYPATQLAGISAGSGYILDNGIHDIWSDYYSALQNMNSAQDIINNTADKETMNNIQAVLYILRAYKTFRITDQFGDIPYFDAGKAYTSNVARYRPKYDSQQEIYDSLLNDLKWAVVNIKTAAAPVSAAGNPYVSLGASDTFFGDDMTKWQTFANSLRLRYAMQMVEKDPAKAGEIVKDVLTGGAPLLDGDDAGGNIEDIGMWPKNFGLSLTDSRLWSFQNTYVRMSSTFWNIVSDGPDSSDIFDPRTYLFVETNQAGKWAPFTIGSGITDNQKNAYGSDRDNNYNNKDNCVFSLFNYHLVRDIEFQPELFITPAEVHFLKAEAYARGIGVAKNMNTAEDEYKAGITASVNFWYYIAHNTNVTSDDWEAVAPPVPTPAQMTNFLNHPKVAFTGSDDDKLKKIYAQEWLSFFRQPWLAYNLWRRTGETPSDPNVKDPTHQNFYRLPYPQDEAVNNTTNYNAEIEKLGGANTSSVKVWWMK